MVALEAGYDLGAIALCFLAIGLLLIAKSLVQSGVSILNVSIFGAHPFGGIATRLENTVLRALNDAIKGVEAATAKFESGLIDALELMLGISLLLGLAIKKVFDYLWSSALRPVIHSISDPVRATANTALAKVGNLADTVDTDIGKARDYAETQAAGALKDAKAYADHWIDNAVKVLHGDISDALNSAEGYADKAVGKLRSAEDQAIADAVGIANAARAAGISAAAGVLRTAEADITTAKNEAISAAAGALSTAEGDIIRAKNEAISAAAGALVSAEQHADALRVIIEGETAGAIASSETATGEAIKTVKAVAVGLGNDLKDLEGIYGAIGTATLIASIPALATLVHAIAEEAGLEKAECRSKVKGICQTDPASWANLLAGLAAVGFAFNLRQLYQVAEPLVAELAPVIAKAA